MKKKTILILAVSVLIIGAGVLAYTFRKSPNSVSKIKPDFIVEPTMFVGDFLTDEINANKKYLDKTVQFTSKLVEIQPNDDNKTTLSFEGNDMGNISCLFDNAELKKTSVEIGKMYIVKGKCSGYILDVVLTKCALVNKN